MTPLQVTEGSCEIARTSGELRGNNSRTQSLIQWSMVISIKPELAIAGVDRLDSRTLSTRVSTPRPFQQSTTTADPAETANHRPRPATCGSQNCSDPFQKLQKQLILSSNNILNFQTTVHPVLIRVEIPMQAIPTSKSARKREKKWNINSRASRTPGPSTETTLTRSPQSF